MKPATARVPSGWWLVAAVLLVTLPGITIAWGEGVYVGNGTDLYSYQLPMRRLVRALALDGQIPTWNPYVLGGVPLHGALQLGLLYPPNWLLLLAAPEQGLGWLFALHLFWLGLGGAALANVHAGRPVQRPRAGAIATATLLMGSGITWGHIWPGHLSFVEAWAWTPWLLAGCLHATRRWRPRPALLAALALALQLLAGHPQVTYLSLAAAIAVLVAHALDPVGSADDTDAPAGPGSSAATVWLRGPLVLAGVVSLGAALAAAQLLPTAALSPLLNRSLAPGDELALAFSAPPSSLLTVVAPSAFGGLNARLASFSYHETLAHLGAAGLVLALISALRRRRRNLVLSLFAMTAVILSLGSHGRLLEALLPVVPGLGSFRVPGRWLLPAILIAAMLAGETTGRWLSASARARTVEDRQPAEPPSSVRGAVLLGLTLAAAAAALTCVAESGWWWGLLDPRRAARFELAEFAAQTRLALWLGAAAGALAAAGLFRPAWRRAIGVALVALLAVESLTFGFAHAGKQARRPAAALDWSPQMAAAVARRVGPGRLATAARLRQANWGGGHGIRVAGGYETAVPAWTNRFANRLAGRRESRYAVNLQVTRPSAWLDRLATSHFVHHRRDQHAARAFAAWPVAGRLSGDLIMRRNPAPMPRLAFAERAIVVADQAAAQARLGGLQRDTITLDRALASNPGAASIKVLLDRPTEIVAEVDCAADKILVLRDALLPGWFATVDDVPVTMGLADGLFRAVAVPAGRHRVAWRYRAPELVAGTVVSLLALLLWAVGWMWSGRRGRGAAAQTRRPD